MYNLEKEFYESLISRNISLLYIDFIDSQKF